MKDNLFFEALREYSYRMLQENRSGGFLKCCGAVGTKILGEFSPSS